MKNKKGLSDVVTTVIIIALVLVAITVLWVVISQLISSNADSIKYQNRCLRSGFELKGNLGDGNQVNIFVKRTSGTDAFNGIDFYAYNSTDSSKENYSENIVVGQLISKSFSLNDANKISIVPYFKEEDKVFYCSPIEYKLIKNTGLEQDQNNPLGAGSSGGSEEGSNNEGGQGNDGGTSGNSQEDLEKYFVFQIETVTNGQNYTFQTDGADTLFIDWGDGNNDTVSGTGLRSHNYTTAGFYNVSLNGIATRIAFGGTGTTPTLLRDVLTNMSDGLTGITSGLNMFNGATNITTFTEPAFFDAVSGNVTIMNSMFNGATNFNMNINSWNTSKVTDMTLLFYQAQSFNQSLNSWEVSSVVNTSYMFSDAISFNGPLENWDTSNVINMDSMFYEASSFNQDISNWNVSSVNNMYFMFADAISFNGPLENWDTSNVWHMWGMFLGAISFNRDLGNWNVSSVSHMDYMFERANLSTDNYDKILNGWSSQKVRQGVYFSAGDTKFSSIGAEGRNKLLEYDWLIYDGGLVS